MRKKNKECPWHTEMELDQDRPPSTAQRVLWSSPVLEMPFGFSTLGTVCCSSWKSVKLTGLREYSQIMRPVSSLEISF